MKAELEQKSVELLGWLEQAIKTSADFGAEQIPLFIQELLLYKFWMSLGGFGISIFALIASIYTAYKFIQWCLKNNVYEAMGVVLFWFIPIVISIYCICSNTDWVMIKLAPRLYLLEYVKDMIKQ
jgi:hydrogenase-4 membrane subunit HyfE